MTFDTEHTDYPVCPYCGTVDGDPGDLDLRYDEDSTVVGCGHCGRDYHVMLHIDYEYTTRPDAGRDER